MPVSNREIEALSAHVRRAIAGENDDFRDNREGAFSLLKNDIYTLIDMNREQARAARRERDQLARYMADISHQLKTPVTSMLVMADLLETVPPERREECIASLKTSLMRMEWLVDVLLKMAKLDAGAVEFAPAEISAAALLKAARGPLEILLDIKDQQVALANDTALFCDARWTAEALTNLLKNASEHSPRGAQILVDSGQNPLYAWVSVTDRGPGVARENYAALFQRFTYSKNENGYGIGLPLALAIVRGQNGDLELDGGGKGTGATFTMKFYGQRA